MKHFLMLFLMFCGMLAVVAGIYADQAGTAASGGIGFGLALGYAFGYGAAAFEIFMAEMRGKYGDSSDDE